MSEDFYQNRCPLKYKLPKCRNLSIFCSLLYTPEEARHMREAQMFAERMNERISSFGGITFPPLPLPHVPRLQATGLR